MITVEEMDRIFAEVKRTSNCSDEAARKYVEHIVNDVEGPFLCHNCLRLKPEFSYMDEVHPTGLSICTCTQESIVRDENLIRDFQDKTGLTKLFEQMKIKLPDPQPTERKVPVKFKHIYNLECFRKFTLWERLGILMGGGLIIQVGVATQHSAGEFQPIFLCKVSKATTPDEHHREVIENMIEQKPYLPVQEEPKSNDTRN